MPESSTAPHPSRPSDVLVVGAGVTGASIAYTLMQAGWSVTVLDAAPEPASGGCSYANAALLAPRHVGPLATPDALLEVPTSLWRRPAPVRLHGDLALAPWLARLAASAFGAGTRDAKSYLAAIAGHSAALHAKWHAAGVSPSYRRVRSLDVHRGRGRRPERPREGVLSGDQLRQLEPHLAPGLGGGVVHDDEAITESRSFVRSLLAAVADGGGSLRFGERVAGLLIENGRVRGVRTREDVILGSAVVVCSGIHSRPILRSAGVNLPLRGGRGYVVDLERKPDDLSHAVRLKGQRVVITPLTDRVRVAGYMEFGAEARQVDVRRADRLRDVACEVVPSLARSGVIERWAGERPILPDGVPAVGPVLSAPGLHVAAGAGMWGLILGPATAELIAQGLSRPREAVVPEWLGPDRFDGLRRSGPLAPLTRGRGGRALPKP